MRLGLRSAPSGLFEAAQGMSSNPQGYFLITPMKLDIGWVVSSSRIKIISNAFLISLILYYLTLNHNALFCQRHGVCESGVGAQGRLVLGAAGGTGDPRGSRNRAREGEEMTRNLFPLYVHILANNDSTIHESLIHILYPLFIQGGSFAPQNYPAQRHLLWTKREDMLQAVGMTEEQIEFEIFEGSP